MSCEPDDGSLLSWLGSVKDLGWLETRIGELGVSRASEINLTFKLHHKYWKT